MHFMLPLLKGLIDHSQRALFKDYVPSLQGPSWRTITYESFLRDLEATAKFIQHHVKGLGVKRTNVVGLWITGRHYEDLVNLYAIARAGFVPQVFSLVMTSQGGTMVNDLLTLCSGKALVYDTHYQDQVHQITVPAFVVPDLLSLATSQKRELLADLPKVDDDDVAVIFHTSGTTSGRPKPVPQSHKWLKFQWNINWPSAWQTRGETQKCFNNVGSFANIASATVINKVVPAGDCIIRTSKPDFDAAELLAMVRQGGLNNMLLYASRLSHLLRVAKSDPDVLEALQHMEQISYTGEALNPDDIRSVIELGLPVVAIYASTEISICLVSNLREPEDLPAMRLLEGSNVQLMPLQEDGLDNHGRLCDVFVPRDAPNCPHLSIRNRPNGHITGDLFEETKPGWFAFRGRSDDWIKSGKDIMALCDTKAIEDTVRLNCVDLVHNCVVVGDCKPVVLFVEPTTVHAESVESPAKLKAEIIKRMKAFQAGLYPHEQFDDRVVVVVQGSLPRTSDKGNIRRNAVEEVYADLLRDIYSKML